LSSQRTSLLSEARNNSKLKTTYGAARNLLKIVYPVELFA
jgi:hypothetical protein